MKKHRINSSFVGLAKPGFIVWLYDFQYGLEHFINPAELNQILIQFCYSVNLKFVRKLVKWLCNYLRIMSMKNK